nr:alpha/beta hydrolase [Actinopolyspora biskrensis]
MIPVCSESSGASPEVRDVVLEGADGVPLSALLAEPRRSPPRAVVVALHGGGMRAGYFHGRAHPSLSLLTLGAELGFTVLAVDRPGYGLSAERMPEGGTLEEQAGCLHGALERFAADRAVGAGFFLVAHSSGGKVALCMAASDEHRGLVGLDLSGCGHRHAVDVRSFLESSGRDVWRLHWGASRFYPESTFSAARSLLTPMPPVEIEEAARWPRFFPGIAGRVHSPVRFTFSEHELWWRHDEESVGELTALLGSSRVRVDRQEGAGHNISLGWAARSYHLRALAFAEDCVRASGAGRR